MANITPVLQPATLAHKGHEFDSQFKLIHTSNNSL